MAEGLEQQQAQPSTHEELGFDERLALLVDREATYRNNNKVTRLLRVAKLKLHIPAHREHSFRFNVNTDSG
jgi:predicted transcriptional regulator